MLGIVALAGLSAVLAVVLLPDEIAAYVAGAALVSGPWLAYVLWLETSGVAALRSGIDGEAWTAAELRKLGRRDWRLVNHVMLEHRDVDHALVGPGGLFAIETKYRSRWAAVSETELDQWCCDAHRSADHLTRRSRSKLAAVPIVVMWGPGARERLPAESSRHGVVFCAGPDLVSRIMASSQRLSPAEAARVYDELVAYVDKRTIGELKSDGPPPRPIADYGLDLLFGLFAAIATVAGIGWTSPVGPLWVTWPTLSLAAGAATWQLRQRSPSPRVRAITTGVLAASGSLLTMSATVMLVAWLGAD